MNLNTTSTDNKRKESNALKACKEILNELLSEKHIDYAWPFYQTFSKELTDVIEKNHGSIENPMNFQIIKLKMENREYKAAYEFATDIRLMCSNCSNLEFLPSLVTMSKKLHQVFEKLYANIIDDSRRNLSKQIADLLVVSKKTLIACSLNRQKLEQTVCYKLNNNFSQNNQSSDSDSDSISSSENIDVY